MKDLKVYYKTKILKLNLKSLILQENKKKK